MSQKKGPLIFVHIPKTAGTTFQTVLDRMYENKLDVDAVNPEKSIREFEDLDEKTQKGFDVIKGHFTMNLVKYTENPILMTFMREPADLVLSAFFYAKRFPYNPFHKDINKMDSVLDFVEYSKGRELDNLQTRHLSNSTGFRLDPKKTIPDMDLEGPELLVRAKKAVEDFDYVFYTNQFNAALLILMNDLGWKKYPYYLTKNKTANREKVSTIDPKTLERLKEINKFDYELFEFSREINKNLLSKYDLEKDLKKFKRRNDVYQKIIGPFSKMINYTKKLYCNTIVVKRNCFNESNP